MLCLQIQICLQIQEGVSKASCGSHHQPATQGYQKTTQLWAVVEAMQTSELFRVQPLTPASTRLGDGPSCMLLLCHHGQHLVDECKLVLSEHTCSSVPSHHRGPLISHILLSPSNLRKVHPGTSASHTNLCSAPANPARLRQPELPR